MLFNQVTWSIYSTNELSLKDPNHIVGNGPGIIQIARGNSKYYDDTAGGYIDHAELSASADGDRVNTNFLILSKDNQDQVKPLYGHFHIIKK